MMVTAGIAPASHPLYERLPTGSTRGLLNRKRQLQPRRQLVDRDRGHPLDPPVTAPIGCDDPNREAMPRIERHATEVCRDQQTTRLPEIKAAIVAGQRSNMDAKPPPRPPPPPQGGGRAPPPSPARGEGDHPASPARGEGDSRPLSQTPDQSCVE